MVDMHVLYVDVVEVLDLPQVEGPVEREAVGVVAHAHSAGAETKGNGGVKSGTELNLGRAVLGDVNQEHEWHASNATYTQIM